MSSCSCRYAKETHLKAGDEVHNHGTQGFAVHDGVRPIVLTWDSVYDAATGNRSWVFKGAQQMTWYSHRHRKAKPLHLDFKRGWSGHD